MDQEQILFAILKGFYAVKDNGGVFSHYDIINQNNIPVDTLEDAKAYAKILESLDFILTQWGKDGPRGKITAIGIAKIENR